MVSLKVNFESKESILKSFGEIAEEFSMNIVFKINNSYYRLLDFEFYAYSESFQDPHTYKNDLQLQNGKLYIHASGVDITSGDGTNYCGILLRSIVKLSDACGKESGYMEALIDGPQATATELLSNLHSLITSDKNEIALIEFHEQKQIPVFCPPICKVSTKRVGLSSKPTDKEDYYKNLGLRYIVILQKFPKFKHTIKGIEGILGEKVISEEITVDAARDILGYNKAFT
jgi:hypothetical protein